LALWYCAEAALRPSANRIDARDEILSYGPWVDAAAKKPVLGVAKKLPPVLETAPIACCKRWLAMARESEYAVSAEANICLWTGSGVPEIWTERRDFAAP